MSIKMMTVRALCLFAVAISATAQVAPPPTYTAATILPSGSDQPTPLAPGMLVTVYGEHLGPATACTGAADPQRREIPNPQRPNQTLVEIQVFPKRLCDTEVRVGGIAAGLLYVGARQINFKVPQELPAEGTAAVQVSYKGRSGPAVTTTLAKSQNTGSAQKLADKICPACKTSNGKHITGNRPVVARAPAKQSLHIRVCETDCSGMLTIARNWRRT